jgi:hypothetical protein
MPIDPDFPKNHKVTGKHSLADGEHFHYLILIMGAKTYQIGIDWLQI